MRIFDPKPRIWSTRYNTSQHIKYRKCQYASEPCILQIFRRILLTPEESFWLVYLLSGSFIHENWNKFTIEITIVYHVNGCRWLKRQCYKFAHWIRLWHIPNVTVTIKWQYYHHCNCYVLMDSQVLSHVSSIWDLKQSDQGAFRGAAAAAASPYSISRDSVCNFLVWVLILP